MTVHDDDRDFREAEDQMAGTARPHSERPGFLRGYQLDPEMEAAVRAIGREIAQQQAQIKPERRRMEVSAPGNPGGPVAGEPKPGARSTEFYMTAAAMVAIVGIVLGTIYYSAEIQGLSGEARALVIGLVSSVAAWALKVLGVDYTGNRTALKLESKR